MGVLDTTYTFTATDVVTSAKLNNVIDQTTFTSSAVATGNVTLAVINGQLKVNTGGITANELADNSVITAKILDSNVTTAKLESSSSVSTGVTTAKIADSAVTEVKLANNAVTTIKIADLNVTTTKLENSSSVSTGVTTAKIADNAVTSAKILNSNVTAAKLSGLQSGSAPIFGARAYGAFDGQAASPITAINSGNITSIARTSTGIYHVVMTTAMQNNSYCVVANASYGANLGFTTSCTVEIVNNVEFDIIIKYANGAYNSVNINFVVFQ